MKRQLNQLSDWLLGKSNNEPIKTTAIKTRFTNPCPSLPNHLAFVDFCDELNCFLLNDGLSIGSGFELASIPTEAASPDYLEAVFKKTRDTFASVVPLHPKDPWIMQMYVNDDYQLKPVLRHLKKSLDPQIAATPFTKDYLLRLEDLFNKMTRPEGLFLDPKTDAPYRGRRRRVRVLFYRLYQELKTTKEAALIEHQEVLAHIESKLQSPGLELKRLTGQDYYQWWVRWFNPNPAMTSGNTEELLTHFPYPKK